MSIFRKLIMLGVLRLVVIVILTTGCFGSKPHYKSKHYKQYKLEDVEYSQYTKKTSERREFQKTVDGPLRTIVENPTNITIPEDDGSALFGDIWFWSTRKDGELIIRDTIVNQIINENVHIYYNRSLPGYYVEDMILYNVGRQRGFCYQAILIHELGYAEAQLFVAANNTIRIFAEIYVRAEN